MCLRAKASVMRQAKSGATGSSFSLTSTCQAVWQTRSLTSNLPLKMPASQSPFSDTADSRRFKPKISSPPCSLKACVPRKPHAKAGVVNSVMGGLARLITN
eukprot:3542489-Pleurochrysis_carterae.AAC.1